MDSDLSCYLSAPTISIINGATVLAGIDPNQCLMDFDAAYTELNTCFPDAEKARLSKASDLCLQLKEDLTEPDSQLDIVNLVAYPLLQAETLSKFGFDSSYHDLVDHTHSHIASLPFDDMHNDRLEVFNRHGELFVSVKNPPDDIKMEIFTTLDWCVDGRTAVTTSSLIAWANRKGILQAVHEPDLLMETTSTGFQEKDVPKLLTTILGINSDYIAHDVMILLKAQLHLCEHGSQGGSTRQVIVDYLKEHHGIQPGSNESERIAMLLHPIDSSAGVKKGAAVIMPSFEEYLLVQNESGDKTVKPQKKNRMMNQFLIAK